MQVNDGDIMPSVAESLAKLCQDKNIKDQDLVLDVYLVCNEHGQNRFIETDDLLQDVEKTDPAYWTSRIEINKRKSFLDSMAKSNYMQALIALNDPMKAVLTFVDHLMKAYQAAENLAKTKQPIGMHGDPGRKHYYASQDHLDIIADRIGEYRSDQTFDDFLASIDSYVDVCESDEMGAFFSGCGLCRRYDAKNLPGLNLAKEVVQHGTNLPAMYPALFKEFTRISDEIGSSSTKLTDSDKHTENKDRDKMEEFSQLDTVDPVEIAQEGYDLKVAEKKLEVDYHQEEEQGVCHLFVLLDTSGSMDGCDLGGRVNRAFAANTLTLSLLRFAMGDKWKVYVVPFAGAPSRHDMQTATDKDSALAAMKWLGGQQYDGGGTDIERAVLFAYDQLKADPDYRKCDIVLITDGCSPISDAIVSKKPPRTKLRTLITASELPYGDHARNLEKASDTFKVVDWDGKKNQLDIGDALSRISDRSSNDEEAYAEEVIKPMVEEAMESMTPGDPLQPNDGFDPPTDWKPENDDEEGHNGFDF